MYKLFTTLSLLLLSLAGYAQPAEGKVLHYRIIGFPCKPGYTLQIAAGNITNEGEFEKNIISHTKAVSTKIIAEVPAFGAQYTWRLVQDKAAKTDDGLHHFSTLNLPLLDTTQNRLRIVKNTNKYNDAYFIADGTRCMYNSNGKPVWYLPDIDGFVTATSQLRDIKMTPQGTITFLAGENAFEINYEGEVLWYMPKSQRLRNLDIQDGHLHHEFTRLKNGHYMVLGNEISWFKKPTPEDNTFSLVDKAQMKPDPGHKLYSSAQFGTVLEYDKAGKLLWSWKAVDHVDAAELYYRKLPAVMVNLDMHQNAFYFDEVNKNIYVSFKFTSQVMKIKYPQGNVLNTYGKNFKPGGKSDSFFCDQHSCKRSKESYLYVFNNNLCNAQEMPSIVMMKEPKRPSDRLEKIWEFIAPVEDAYINELKKLDKSHFGNVMELPDGNLFSSSCSPFGYLFIVSRKKEILWQAVTERYDGGAMKWQMVPNYRASFIGSRKDVERMVWTKGN